MKKLLLIPVLALLCLFAMPTETQAQEIKNTTTCAYSIQYWTAPPPGCFGVAGPFTAFSPASTTIGVLVPFGHQVVGYRAVEVIPGPVCDAFKVGRACFGLPTTYSFSCSCTATATFFPLTPGDLLIN